MDAALAMARRMFLRLSVLLLLIPASLPAQVGYGGPAASTQGRTAGARGGAPVDFRLHAGVFGSYDNGLIGVGLDRNGKIVNSGGLYGVEANVGLYGTKLWGRRRLGLDYLGNYRRYNTSTFINGTDHILSLDFSQQVSRRIGVFLRGTGGTSTRPVGGVFNISGIGFGNTDFISIPINDVFDNRIYFAEVTGGATIQKGVNWVFTAGGSGFAVRRRSSVLIGLNGQRAFGDVQRRVGRRSFVSLSYSYMHMDYPRVFGEADVNGLSLTYNTQIGRSWTFGLGAGAFRVDFAGVRTVEVDPVVQELLGIRSGREAFNQVNTLPNFFATVSRNLTRKSTFAATAMAGVNPGNGIVLVSRSESLMVSYNYNASRKWTTSVYGNYMRLRGLGNFGGRFDTYGGGASAGYRLSESLQLTTGVDFRRLGVSSSNFNRWGTRVMVGLSYAPGEFPFSFR